MNYQKWEETVPDEMKGDAVWKIEAYRLALFEAELCWFDVTKLISDKRTISLGDQLYRAAGAVSADIEEGYSRASGKDRARFYEYALGSARETRGWYFKARHVLGAQVTHHRLALLTRIIRLLLTMVPDQRSRYLNETPVSYFPTGDPDVPDFSCPGLLEDVPMP